MVGEHLIFIDTVTIKEVILLLSRMNLDISSEAILVLVGTVLVVKD
jgi:hypothetical protein